MTFICEGFIFLDFETFHFTSFYVNTYVYPMLLNTMVWFIWFSSFFVWIFFLALIRNSLCVWRYIGIYNIYKYTWSFIVFQQMERKYIKKVDVHEKLYKQKHCSTGTKYRRRKAKQTIYRIFFRISSL